MSVLEEQQERQKPAQKRKLPGNPGDEHVQQTKKRKPAPKKKKSSDKENINPIE